MYLNPCLFLLIDKGSLYVWDYKNHQQYEIDESTLKQLLQVSARKAIASSHDLEAAGLISHEPYPALQWKWDKLSHIFHVGTQNIGQYQSISTQDWVHAHLTYSLSVDLTSDDLFYSLEGPKIPLKPDESLFKSASFHDVLLARKTSRQFQKRTVDFKTFSTLIYTVFGTVHEDFKGDHPHYVGLRKTSPSGGGLHPTECFIIAWTIEGLTPGIYHYDVKSNGLTFVEKGLSYDDIKDIFYGQPYMEDCAFGLVLTCRFHVIWKKYFHSRSYRDALIDVGLISQTALLTATALGLCTWEAGLFEDTRLAEHLHIKNETMAPLFFLSLGYGYDQNCENKTTNR